MGIREHYPGGRFGLAAVALVACLAMSQIASAVTVTYSTSGAFEGPGAAGAVLYGQGPGNSKLSFKGMGKTDVDVTPPNQAVFELGKFSLTSATTGFDVYAGFGDEFGQSFELILEQFAPEVGTEHISTKLVFGAVVKRLGGFVGLAFNNTNFSIGSVGYEIADTVIVKAGTSQTWTGTLTARRVSDDDVNVVPLPAAAWGGVALMGFIAARKLRRRKHALSA